MKKKRFIVTIGGIDCSGCSRSFEQSLVTTEGIIDARINLAYKRLFVDYDADVISEEQIQQIVKKAGHFIIEDTSAHGIAESSYEQKKKPFASIFKRKEVYTTGLSGLLLLAGALLDFVFTQELAAMIVLIVGAIIGGLFIARKAFFSIIALRLDINVLMTIASIAAIIIGDTIEATSIVFLFSIAELAESFSVERAKKSIENLIAYAPTDVSVLEADDKIVIKAAKDVPVNAIIQITAGERIPLDGTVVHGESYINQAPITGESMPVLKDVGATVYAGTLVENGLIQVKVTKPYDEIFLRKIVALVESSDQRTPIERYVDTFAKYYTPVMFLIASLTMFIPPLITGDPFIDWVYIGLIILVISCPCAVVLSTPVTIVTALSRAAKQGVLIKGGRYIETLSKTKIIAFDKTGTLTVGHPQVLDIFSDGEYSVDELIKICGSLEKKSTHPIAKAIVDELESRRLASYPVDNFESSTGLGVQGVIKGAIWFAASPKIIALNNLKISETLATNLTLLQAEQKTVVLICDEFKVQGLISVADQMKTHAKGVIHELRTLTIEEMIMLTGDNPKTAAVIAQEIGVDDYKADLLPDQKMALVEKLNAENQGVVMIGDGVNDAPALAKAAVGIAMGATGSDIALETADIALMSDSLESLYYLLTLSKKAMRVIKQNIGFAILIKLLLFVLSYFGFIQLWMAVLIGDMGVSLLVIANALLRVRGKKMKHWFCDENLCSRQETFRKGRIRLVEG